MPPTARRLLIVEDDAQFRSLYRLLCRQAANELRAAGLDVDVTLAEASTYAEAASALSAPELPDLISLDLALPADEEGGAAGGMRLLHDLRRRSQATLAMVVSGERKVAYARDAIQRYGVLTYLLKPIPTPETYTGAVKAALWYLSAKELLCRIEDLSAHPSDFDRVADFWRRALEAGQASDISTRCFPEDLGARQQALRNLLLDPDTSLPHARWTEQLLKRHVLLAERWALVRLRLRSFGGFLEAQASQGRPLLYFMADSLRQAVGRASAPAFVGVLGWEYGEDPCYVVVLPGGHRDAAEQLASWMLQRYDGHKMMFQDRSGRHETAAPPALDVRVWATPGDDDAFADLHDLLNTVVR